VELILETVALVLDQAVDKLVVRVWHHMLAPVAKTIVGMSMGMLLLLLESAE
jgi:hypothetical protein